MAIDKTTGLHAHHGPGGPITDADLHAYVDRQLDPTRRAEVEAYLQTRPDKRQQVNAWQEQNERLRNLLNPVLDEAIPARFPLRPPAPAAANYPWRGLAAGIAIAVVSASSAWVARGSVEGEALRLAMARPAVRATPSGAELTGFAHRAAVAHVVYSPDIRRPVEVGAEQEQQLVTWLSKRLGSPVKPPALQTIGYELIGGRLLPGDKSPVAQFMYHDATGQRLTLYVTGEIPNGVDQPKPAFRFGRDGPVNVFYWVDRHFGYAISGGADRAELLRISQEVYRQLASN